MQTEPGLIQHSATDLEAWLTAAGPEWSPFPPASDRAAWQALRERLGRDETQRLISHGDEAAGATVPALPATLWLEFVRTGQREGYQTPQSRRRALLSQLAIAECLDGSGRFLDAILDLGWAICEESSWCMPAHQPELAEVRHPMIDLRAAHTGVELAELDHLLSDRLHPALRQRIRDEVDRRLLVPYLERHDFWWMSNTERRTVNNWTAVCTAGVAGAACYLETQPTRLADILAKAARSLQDYLATFDRDGGSTEGPGYWSYGFGYYIVIGHLVEARTAGRARWMDPPIVREAAQFPLRTVLSPDRYVNFSDCDPDVQLNPSHLAYLAYRLELPQLAALARRQSGAGGRTGQLTWALRALFWAPPAEGTAAAPVPSRHDFFGQMHWMVARSDPTVPDALVLAVKGGHNGEMHNQNDVGNFIVHLHQESIVPDVGRGRYTRDYFGPLRYEHLANSSLGHSVPVPNGCAQLPGKSFGAELLEHRDDGDEDSLTLELKGAYPPQAGLASLIRRVALRRGAAPWVEVEDRVRFAGAPGTLESVLTTFAQARQLNDHTIQLRGERATVEVLFDPAVVRPEYELVQGVDLAGGPADVLRLRFVLREASQEATVKLELRSGL